MAHRELDISNELGVTKVQITSSYFCPEICHFCKISDTDWS